MQPLSADDIFRQTVLNFSGIFRIFIKYHMHLMKHLMFPLQLAINGNINSTLFTAQCVAKYKLNDATFQERSLYVVDNSNPIVAIHFTGSQNYLTI